MTRNDPVEELIRDLRYKLAPEAKDRILERACGAMDEIKTPAPAFGRPRMWRMTMNSKAGKCALAAAVILIVLGGITLWPFARTATGPWWLGPSAAWGQEILRSLEAIQAVVYRQRAGYTSDYGAPEMSKGYEIRFNAKDRYRRDRYDDGVHIMNTQWVVPDGNGVQMIEVSYEYECWFSQENEAYGFMESMIDRMRWYVDLLDRADRVLATETFDGHECVGFEICASKYGDNAEGRFDRIWFDVDTRLPMRIERCGITMDYDPARKLILIHDQFEYFAEVPPDLFVPEIPDGYVNAHPDEVRTARDAQVKGEMVFADVPPGLEEKIVGGLEAVETGAYRQGDVVTSFSGHTWRKDTYSDTALAQTVWFALDESPLEGPFEMRDGTAVKETSADFQSKTFRVVDHTDSPQPRHPMRDILFVAGLLSQADHFYENAEIDGIVCFGFEVSAKKYGDNPDGMLHRVWLDRATYLPVRIEFVWPPNGTRGTRTEVKEQFEWNPLLPDGFFTPQIPGDFTLATD
jgi:outer membrane lipoprotein-sorting protein